MSNMAYCRFENTVNDLANCEDNMGETLDMSVSERHARAELIVICKRIAEEYGDEDEVA